MSNTAASFNADILQNNGYRYTTKAQYSSVVANQRITRAVIECLTSSHHKVIDVGCGDGYYTQLLQEALPEKKFVGFDLAQEAVKVATRMSSEIEYVVADVLAPPKKFYGFFDVAIMRGVIHHLANPRKGIERTAFLADELVIVEPNGNNPILKWIEKNSEYHKVHDEQSFTTAELSFWCIEAGLEVKMVRYIGFVPFFFPKQLSIILQLFQPILERVPVLRKYFAAQILLVAKKAVATRTGK